jgi:acyl carrier protein
MDLLQELKDYILNEHLPGESPERLTDDLDLIGTGILDSLAIMKLVLHLQQRYGVEMPPAEIAPENLGTVARLAAYVASRQGA